jgi:hypothetical protein
VSIDVPKTEARAFEEPLNSWKPYRHPDGSRGAIYTCPNGHTGSLEGWKIADDGAVSPSVDCSPNGCDFHDHIRLLDWSAAGKETGMSVTPMPEREGD